MKTPKKKHNHFYLQTINNFHTISSRRTMLRITCWRIDSSCHHRCRFASSMNVGGVLNYPTLNKIPTVRQLFESDKPNVVRKPAVRSKTKAEKDAADINKCEMDLVKNLAELVISSENDFNKNNKAPMPTQNVMEKPPILWFYVDPH
jgi:hypothetical protein